MPYTQVVSSGAEQDKSGCDALHSTKALLIFLPFRPSSANNSNPGCAYSTDSGPAFDPWQTQDSVCTAGNVLVPCIDCDKQFRRFNEWIRHKIEVHHPECRLGCPHATCGYSASPTLKHRLRDHYERAHHGILGGFTTAIAEIPKHQVWNCGFCPSAFDSSSWRDFGRHIWNHLLTGCPKQSWNPVFNVYDFSSGNFGHKLKGHPGVTQDTNGQTVSHHLNRQATHAMESNVQVEWPGLLPDLFEATEFTSQRALRAGETTNSHAPSIVQSSFWPCQTY